MKDCHMKKGLSRLQEAKRNMMLNIRSMWKSHKTQNFLVGNKNEKPAGTKILRKFKSKAATIRTNIARVGESND